jgi:hypothetical protein
VNGPMIGLLALRPIRQASQFAQLDIIRRGPL